MDPAIEPPAASGRQLSSLSLPIFIEGVSLVLSEWTALKLAVEHLWGGKDSRRKSHELGSVIVSWFTQSNGTLDIDNLAEMLKKIMRDSFSVEIGDESHKLVAEVLMTIHEGCLQGNYASIEKRKTSKPLINAVSQSIKVIINDEDESSDDDVSDMIVDEPKPKAAAVDKPKSRKVPDEEGWTVVSSKRERGRRSGYRKPPEMRSRVTPTSFRHNYSFDDKGVTFEDHWSCDG